MDTNTTKHADAPIALLATRETEAHRDLAVANVESDNVENAVNHLIEVLRLNPQVGWSSVGLVIISGTLNGVTVNRNRDGDGVATVNGANLTAQNGLTVNGTLQGQLLGQWAVAVQGVLTNMDATLVLIDENNLLTLQAGTTLAETVVATNGASLIVNRTFARKHGP